MSKYSSILKGAKDLLTKPYCYDNKVELKTKAANGVTFTSEAAILDKDGSASALVKAEGSHGNFKVKKLQIGTDKKIAGEFELAAVATNVDASFKFTEGSRAASASNDATLGAVVTKKADSFTSVLTVDAELVNGPTFDVSALVDYKGVLVGASTKVATSLAKASDAKDADNSVSVADYNALLGYRTGDYTVAAQTAAALSHVDVSLHHVASPSLTAGFLVGFDRAAPAKSFDVSFGGTYKVDSAASVSLAASSKGTVSMGFKQKLNSMATLNTCGQVDALQLGSDNHKFGLTLSLAN